MYPSRLVRRPILARLVLVLNRSWVAVHVTTVRRAICMLYQEAALAVATDSLQTHSFEDWVGLDRSPSPDFVRASSRSIPAPEVIQLRAYNKVPVKEAPFTRRNLYQRDNYTCQYCARRASAERLSIDHVQPRSRGGRTSWENCVLACVRCNAHKADRPLQESGLRLLRQPRRPTWSPYLNLPAQERLTSWRRFTPKSQWKALGHNKATGS